MRRALEILGVGRTMHGFLLGTRPGDIEAWADLVELKYGRNHAVISAADFDRAIGDCAAVTDMPCSAFWPELMAAYPDAKIILVERPLKAWHASFRAVVVEGLFSRAGRFLASPLVARFAGDKMLPTMTRLFLAYFGARDADELDALAEQVYVEHNAAVREACRKQGREMLDYKFGSGWAPLCAFLGVPEPPKDVEFPRGNESHAMVKMTKQIQRQRIWQLGSRLGMWLAVGGAAVVGRIYFL